MVMRLTQNGIQQLLSSDANLNQNIILQACQMTKKISFDNQPCSIVCMLSDGCCSFKGLLQNTQKTQFNHIKDNNCVLKVTKHMLISIDQIIKAISILEFEMILLYDGVIGLPSQCTCDTPTLHRYGMNILSPNKILKLYPISTLSDKNGQNIILQISEDDKSQEIPKQCFNDYDTISDLYTDLQNWVVICRIINSKFKDFVSKAGKPTKILNLELMDRKGIQIEATMFGEKAEKQSKRLQKNKIYKIECGQIREQNYKNTKNPKQSTYNILLTTRSKLTLVHDNGQIPNQQQEILTIHEVLVQSNFDTLYNIACILIQIKPQTALNNNQKATYLQKINIIDPQNELILEVAIWNKDIEVQHSMINQAVLLKKFRLKTYNGTLSFNSFSRSQIVVLQNHKYNCLNINSMNISNFKNTSQHFNNSIAFRNNIKTLKNIKQLQIELIHLNNNEQLYSDIDGWVSHINFKNDWYYQGCPKCKKSCQENTKCIKCSQFIKETSFFPKLHIQIADSSASIWSTAFDEFSKQLFRTNDLKYLKEYSDVELRNQAEKKSFQEFSFRIMTKKDDLGRVKHQIIGRPIQINYLESAIANITNIKQHL